MIFPGASVNEKGHLTFGGADTTELAAKFGTALYVLDENRVRENCRKYVRSMNRYFPAGSVPLYASKALCCKEIYRIVKEESMNVDIVSSGELYTAISANFPTKNIYFHGNNKTVEDIQFAIDNGIGYFVADNMNELTAINKYAGEKGIKQKILLRVTPGIDPHTYAAVNTGKIDCQFGSPIATGQALEIAGKALNMDNIQLCGFHCHVGSQIFSAEPYIMAVDIMMEFLNEVRSKFGFTAPTLNLGGGFGVRYVESDPEVSIPDSIGQIAQHLNEVCSKLDYPVPSILMEPGRSIVADACITLYTIGGRKVINGYRDYVTVDGGMADNPRYALYGSAYTAVIANKAEQKPDYKCTIAGRCCETGDLIQEDVLLADPQRGDILAVFTTGAYNYSMASNYNRLCRPAMVAVKNGNARLIIRRESFEDLIKNDI